MGPIAAATTRSAITSIAAFAVFIAASLVLMSAPIDYKLHALRRSLTDAPMLLTLGAGWLAFMAWLWLEGRKPPPSRNRFVRIGWAAATAILIAAGLVALNQVLYAASGGVFFFWSYWLRLFAAALFAVAVVRIALPLLPRFDRMTPRSV